MKFQQITNLELNTIKGQIDIRPLKLIEMKLKLIGECKKMINYIYIILKNNKSNFLVILLSMWKISKIPTSHTIEKW
jgi:hypothetical protein